MFEIPLKCFGVTGFKKSDKYPRIVKAIQLYFIAASSYCVFSGSLFVAQNYNDVMAAAEAFGPTATTLIALGKHVVLYYYLDEFYALMDKIKELATGGIKNQ